MNELQRERIRSMLRESRLKLIKLNYRQRHGAMLALQIEGKAWYRLVGCLAVVGCYIAISIDRKNYCLYTSSL